MQITQKLVLSVRPTDKAFEIRDSKLKGFILRVQPSGSTSFICEYTRGKRITIGKANVLTLTAARNKAKEILGRFSVGEPIGGDNKNRKTLGDYIHQDYGLWALSSMRTGKHRLHELKLYFGYLYDQPIAQITPWLIEKWRLGEFNRGIKSATVHRNETTLRAAINKAVEWGFIATSPLKGFKPLKVEDNRIVSYLTSAAESRLLAALNDRELRVADHLKTMVLLSLHTGLRRGELLALKWQSISFDNKLLTVEGHSAKSGQARHIPLNKVALAVLKQWQTHVESEFVFPGKSGGRLGDCPKKAWLAVLKAAGITGFRWHDMRHHFASRLVMAAIDLNTVRELLGHSDLKMTLRYAHLAPEHKAAAVAVLE